MENKTCQYEGCNEPVNSPHDGASCVFHAPVDKKGITDKHFNRLILTRWNEKKLNFRGFIFPGDFLFSDEDHQRVFPSDVDFSNAKFMGTANFCKANFQKDAKFKGAQFEGKADFREVQFEGKADLREARFSGDAYFHRARFSADAFFFDAQFSGDVSFESAQFSGEASFSIARFSADAYFVKAQFSGDAYFEGPQFSGYAYFREAQFSADASFSDAQFSVNVYFRQAQFSGDAYFGGAQFSGDAYFTGAQFSRDASFLGITIESVMNFAGIKMGERAIFNLESPSFKGAEEKKSPKNLGVIFDRVRFNPFAASFEKIYADKSPNQSYNPVLIFRYCQLKDVFFSKSDMSLFSFYKSSFDEARFISSLWGDTKDKILGLIPFRRKNIIAEDNMQPEIDEESNEKDKTKLREKYMIQDLAGPDDIASLYRRMKTALDRSKDYEQSGWFYFNEIEMKRRALKEKQKNRNILRRLFSRLPLYNIYKTFAGYGEKPLWSFWWFLTFSVLFSFLHMFSGLDKAPNPRHIEYSLTKIASSLFSIQFWKDFVVSWSFSLSRLIPANYLSAEVTNYYTIGSYGNLLSFLNFIVLFIMATFIFIGLKRHFRRF